MTRHARAWRQSWCRPCRRSGRRFSGLRRGLAGSLHALLQRRFDEGVEVAVEHLLRGRSLVIGAQVLDAALVEHIAADLVAPAHVGLAVFELLLLGLALAHLVVIEARAKALPGDIAVAVLAAAV